MLYPLLRSATRVALRWYYSDVIVQGRARIPVRGPLLIVANHPNALVDAMLVVASVDRRVLLTAKATLFENPLLAPLLRAVGVVPLRRAKDERARAHRRTAVSRNDDAFRKVTEGFRHNRVVLVFPEGISHDEPSLAQLKSGAARMVLGARDAAVRAIHILPVGLVFEEKERPRSRVLVRIGEALDVDSWCAAHTVCDAGALTREIDARVRRVTLNFATAERASVAVRVARALAALATEQASVAAGDSFALQAELAARVESATEGLVSASVSLVSAAEAFVRRLDTFETKLAKRGVALADSRISLRARSGVRFAFRETALVVLTFPIALLGRLTHRLPIQIARVFALRSSASRFSRDQPAMRTIILGFAVLVFWYALLAVLVTRWMGGISAVLVLIAAFAAAQVDVRLEDRLTRALRRARAYLVLRGDAELRSRMSLEIDALLAEAVALEQALIQARGRSV